MFDRIEIKSKAKETLNGKLFDFFVIFIVLWIFSGGIVNVYRNNYYGIVLLYFSAIAIVFNIFIYIPLMIGKNRYCLNAVKGEQRLNDIFYIFKCGHFSSVLGIYVWMEIKILLWSLLLIVPGIIKSFEYYMVPYILADDPSLSSQEVFAKSKAYTDGIKMDIFILNLSFIGWWILVSCTCGIIGFYVSGYVWLSETYLYLERMQLNNDPGNIYASDEKVINVEVSEDETK